MFTFTLTFTLAFAVQLLWLISSEAVATGEQNIIPPAATKAIPTPIMLADLCEDDSDLHKDAVFLDQLGKLLSDAETTKKFPSAPD